MWGLGAGWDRAAQLLPSLARNAWMNIRLFLS